MRDELKPKTYQEKVNFVAKCFLELALEEDRSATDYEVDLWYKQAGLDPGIDNFTAEKLKADITKEFNRLRKSRN